MNNTKKKGERTCLGTGTNMWRLIGSPSSFDNWIFDNLMYIK
jgi:hypothetical protein